MDLAVNEELDFFFSLGDFHKIDGFLADAQALRVFLSTAEGSYVFEKNWGVDFAFLRSLEEEGQAGEYMKTLLEGRLGKNIASVAVKNFTKNSNSLCLVLELKKKNLQDATILELCHAY